MKINSIAIDKLIPYHNNPRKDQAVDKVASSINEYGFQQPIVVDKNMVVIVGHTRLMGAKKLGLKRVPTVIADLSETQAKAYRIADNRINEDSTWDMELLNLEIAGLSEVDFDLDLLGFDSSELDKFLNNDEEYLTDEDEVPEPPKEPKSKLGDVYQLGEHRLMCGNSEDLEQIEKLMDNQKADLLHTDPPYNVDYSNSDRPKPSKNNLGKIKNDVMSKDKFFNFLKDCFVCAFAVLKKDSTAYIWHSDKEIDNFIKASVNSGFKFSQQIIWKKPMLLGRGRYQYAHEPCLFCVKGSPYFTDDRTKTTGWDFGGYDKSKNVHPTQKPVFIPEEAIKNSSKQGSNILDLFGGSGSTLIACEKLGRNSFTMELDPKYVDVIIERWENFTGKKAKKIC